jgi:valyl-tRNA synthetase
MAKDALSAVEDGRIKIKPETARRSYIRWMSNIEPYVFLSYLSSHLSFHLSNYQE